MKAIKTIKQSSTTYTINQFGNCSFRISYTYNGENRVHHVVPVFDTLQDAEEYIRECANMDKFAAMANK